MFLNKLVITLCLCMWVSQAGASETLHFVMWKPNQPELWDRIVGIFERETGVSVIREIGPHSSTAAHALVTQKLKNRDPKLDVFMMDVTWPPEFAAAGWASSLDRFFAEEQRQDFFPGAIRACTFRGKLYGIPFWTSGGLLYYRKDLLQKYGFDPPTTWEQLVRQADTIVRGERKDNPALKGYSGQFKQYEGLVCDMQEFVLSNNGRLLDYESRKSTIGLPANLQAVRFVRDRIIGKIASRGVLTYEEPESLHVFIQGHAVFLRNWPYAWAISNDPNKSRVAGLVDITVLPHFPGGQSASTLGGWQFAMSRFSTKKQLAWTFIEFMTSPRIQKILAIDASQAPARKSVYRDPEVLEKNPHFAKLSAVFENTRPRPAMPLYPLYSAILQRFYHKAISHERSPLEKLAEQADDQVRYLLQLQEEAGM
ncbi:MAG: ABC transporter substrate-binding protein [Desulfomonilaceae bacterium]|nr:ABC transporter substrate-binding protein [Desulfomonilaceae bacterium]